MRALGQENEGYHILFYQKNKVTIEATNEDPILLSADIGNNTIRRILIDDGSAVEILSYYVY